MRILVDRSGCNSLNICDVVTVHSGATRMWHLPASSASQAMVSAAEQRRQSALLIDISAS